ncbi:MAG: acyltransferase family protein, partial [Nocardioides sp.]
TFTQLYRPELLPSSLTQMWSLCTEVAFYVLLPLLCWLLTWRPGRRGHTLHLPTVLGWSAAFFALGVAWQAAAAQIPGNEGHYAQWLPGYLPWFVVGIVFSAVSASLTLHPRDHVLDRMGSDLVGCWIAATAVFALAATPIAGPRTLLTPEGWEAGPKVVLYAVASGLYLLPLVFGPERDGWVRRQLSGPVLFWLGEISYGIFAIHMIVLNLVFHLLDLDYFTGRYLAVAALTFAITIPLATASFYLLERPILRFKNAAFVARRETEAPQEDAAAR